MEHIAALLRARRACVFPVTDLPGGAELVAAEAASREAAAPLISRTFAAARAVAEIALLSSHLRLCSPAPFPEQAAGCAALASSRGAAYTHREGPGALTLTAAMATAAPPQARTLRLCSSLASDILKHCAGSPGLGLVLAALAAADPAAAGSSLTTEALLPGAEVAKMVDASLLTMVFFRKGDDALRIQGRPATTLCARLPGAFRAEPREGDLLVALLPGHLLALATGITAFSYDAHVEEGGGGGGGAERRMMTVARITPPPGAASSASTAA